MRERGRQKRSKIFLLVTLQQLIWIQLSAYYTLVLYIYILHTNIHVYIQCTYIHTFIHSKICAVHTFIQSLQSKYTCITT